jgi:hypothetical protein
MLKKIIIIIALFLSNIDVDICLDDQNFKADLQSLPIKKINP